jgi:hypothetical protein
MFTGRDVGQPVGFGANSGQPQFPGCRSDGGLGGFVGGANIREADSSERRNGTGCTLVG